MKLNEFEGIKNDKDERSFIGALKRFGYSRNQLPAWAWKFHSFFLVLCICPFMNNFIQRLELRQILAQQICHSSSSLNRR